MKLFSPYLATLQRIHRLCFNEIRLMTHMYRYYKWSYLVNIIMTVVDFIWWIILLEGGIFHPEKVAPLALGYIVWAYANYTIYDANTLITEASQTGVLEQMYISNSHIHTHVFVRCIAGTLFCSLEQCLVIGIVLLLFPLVIPINSALISIFMITLLGIFGFSFMVAGLGLIFKRSQPFCYLINNLLLFFNGAILPLDSMPYAVQLISKTLPTTQGIHMMRAIAFEQATFMGFIANGSLIMLIVNTLMYIALGWITLTTCERYAQKEGLVGQY